MLARDPFPSVAKCGESWPSFGTAVNHTRKTEEVLIQALQAESGGRLLDWDSSLVLCGSFARYEMGPDSDCDWTLLINGVVSSQHAQTARLIERAIQKADGKGLKSPGSSGTLGNMCFSHDLVHRIGGGADSNANLTRRVLMLLESRPVTLPGGDSSQDVWNAVVRSILERYFEEDAHFSPSSTRKVPRFLLNDLTRYWRTIGVDYAAKYLEQDGKKWAIRNAKLRLSRKLLFAAGMAFCFACQLQPPSRPRGDQGYLFSELEQVGKDDTATFIASAVKFAGTPPLEFLAAFVDTFVSERQKCQTVSKRLFGAYNAWLELLGDETSRKTLESLSHEQADQNPVFQKVREISSEFSSGLKLLFFNRDQDTTDEIANLSIEYVAF